MSHHLQQGVGCSMFLHQILETFGECLLLFSIRHVLQSHLIKKIFVQIFTQLPNPDLKFLMNILKAWQNYYISFGQYFHIYGTTVHWLIYSLDISFPFNPNGWCWDVSMIDRKLYFNLADPVSCCTHVIYKWSSCLYS